MFSTLSEVLGVVNWTGELVVTYFRRRLIGNTRLRDGLPVFLGNCVVSRHDVRVRCRQKLGVVNCREERVRAKRFKTLSRKDKRHRMMSRISTCFHLHSVH